MRRISIQTRAIALLTAAAVVLGGAAIWRFAAAPRFLLADRAGDRAALTGFTVDLSFGDETSFCSDVTIRDGRLSVRSTYQPEELSWYRSPLDGKDFVLSAPGQPARQPYAVESDIELVPVTDGYTVRALLQMRPDTDPGQQRSLLLGDLHFSSGSSLSAYVEADAPNTLRMAADGAPRATNTWGRTTSETSRDATYSVNRFTHENATEPFATLLESNARLHEKRYTLIGPYDDAFGGRYTGSAVLCRLDEASDNLGLSPAAATVLDEYPVAGRSFLGLAVFSDDLLLLVAREGDEVVLTLLDADGRTVSGARLAYPGEQTQFTLAAAPPDATGAVHALLTLRGADRSAPSDGRWFQPTPDTCFRLSYADGALTAAGPWSETDFGGFSAFQSTMLGTRLLAVRMQYTHPDEGISYRRMDYDEASMNIRTDQEAVLAVYDLSGAQPVQLYRGAIALPVRPMQNPLFYTDDSPSIRKLEGRVS